ncbi:MAG: recombination protein RecR [Anaerolineae bacterium]|nr:MAG: recombination protein RecR [Anaerolineae bacterium]
MLIPEPVQRLIDAFSRLPGVGPKTASRLTFFMLRGGEDLSLELASALQELKANTAVCQQCFNITGVGRTLCEVCAHPRRDPAQICVVEEPLDVLALERTGGFEGHYHVLDGALNPIEGIGPDDLHIKELTARVAAGTIKEVIIATNPSIEGDATAMYIQQQLAPFGVRLTRLARGLPVGGDLEYADQNTLLRALSGRQDLGE